jgi:hypothetical protein
MNHPNSLQIVWNLAGYVSGESREWCMYFDPVGLLLLPTLENYGYWCTPKNSKAFATTGGDGVHFSFLCDGMPTDNSPIVMTVPMMFDDANIIVGANLVEFLALGSKFGYFGLEHLAYDFNKTVQELETQEYQQETTETERQLLQKITVAFHFEPWVEVGKRLHELKSLFFNSIELPEENANSTEN